MGEEDEVKQGMGSKIANTAKEQGKEAVKKQGKKAAKKIASKFSKKFAQKAASASMKGPMMILMLKILVVILIIMAIIGIIMFVVTMPGMVMEKLKALFKSIGNAIASFFGQDSAVLQADEEKINETLTYLEQMGYDLKGEGFITASYTNDNVPDDKEGVWEGDKEHENTGVIRSKEDDSIVMAHSEFVFNYLISDNYVYTVKNFNIVTGDSFWSALGALFIQIGSVFGYNAGADWGEGMIALYDEGSSVGKKGELYESGVLGWENIDVDAEARTMTIRRGWFQNKMVFSLDGWTGRYGMPLEFLLSVHLATKMPDLPYDMVQAFGGQGSDLGTEVNIVLHPLDGVSAVTGYKKDFATEGTAETDYITYGEMEEIKGEGWIFTDSWTLSKKEAAKVMKLGVKSPDGCTYKDPTFYIIDQSDNGDKWIADPDNLQKLKDYGFVDSEFEDINEELGNEAAQKSGEKFKVKEALVEVKDEKNVGTKSSAAKLLGYDYNKVKSAGGYYINEEPEKINGGQKELIGECGGEQKGKSFEGGGLCDTHSVKYFDSVGGYWVYSDTGKKYCSLKYEYYQIEKYVVEREWQADYDENGDGKTDREDVTFRWVSYVYKVYKYTDKERTKGKDHVTSFVFDYIMRDLTFDELVEKGILNPDGTAVKEQRCSNDKNLEECCATCKNHVKKIMKLMKDGDDPDFDTYTPYIADVTNHWYRDVYFATTGNKNFVQVDQEYEALMGERWTLYETDDNGQYVLYELNDDGTISNRVFNGTQQDANEKGVPVVKKAETIKITDKDADGDQLIDWVKNGDVWSAYKLNTKEESTGWQPLYEESEKAEEDKTTEEILKERMFVNITTKNDITQVEEGQRTATNSKIRNMFLNNIYFRYDGSPETADIIEALRKKISGSDLKFGHLNESDLSATVELDTDEDGKKEKYTAKDYAGRVELTQDSLSAFSMLENTHTLDADFIYKDFKELVVELGYFTKEELSDETPRIFAWLIPEIGSGGYPIASLDKKENEYGTQAHSKEDYQANVKNTLAAAIAAATANEKSEEEKFDVSGKPIESEAPKGIDLQTEQSKELDRLVGEIKLQHDGADDDFIVLGGLNSSKELLSLEGWWEEAQKIFDIYKKDSWMYDDHSPDSAQSHGCYSGTTFDEVKDGGSCGWNGGKSTDCSIGASWLLQKLGALQENHTFTSHMGTNVAGKLDESNVCAQDLLDAGAQVIIPAEGTKFTAAANAGELEPGDVLFYDGHVSIYCGESYEINGTKTGITDCWDTGGDSGIQGGGPKDCSWENRDIELIVRLPFGNGGGSGDPYEGFEGGEAVVSPVTGILLEYGTYQKGEIDPVTEKESRVNVDFQYVDNDEEEKADEGSGTPSPEPDPEPIQDVIDYVGYAKIMILDTETYLELENQMKSSAPKAIAGMKDREGNAIQSLVDKDGNYLENSALKSPDILTSDDASVKWSDKEISLYGYKEFAEMYSEFGVAGNVIFIDGFKCELPVEGGGEEKKDDDKEEDTTTPKILDGEDINKDYFENNANNDEFDKVLYEKEERYNLSSLDATNKLNNENDIKAEADPIIKVGDKLLIKEGTIIGRTMTNDEVMAEREKNGIVTPAPKKEATEPAPVTPGTDDKEENTDPIVGNYLRIIMRDEDDTVVENVEEYMKLDEADGGVSQNGDQEYQFQEGDLDLLADAIHHEGCGAYDDPSGSKEDQLYLATSVGYTIINKLNSDSGYAHAAGWDWAPDKSQLYNLLCVVPCAGCDPNGKGWYAISDEGTLGGLKNRADLEQYEYCDMCMEAAEYIMANDSLNFKNNGKYGSQFSSGEGMPHSCYEQGANYYGNHKIWAQFRSNYLFDVAQ